VTSAAERRRIEQAWQLRAIARDERRKAAGRSRHSDLTALHLGGGIDSERRARLFPSRYGKL
jgi:hypothetical protein